MAGPARVTILIACGLIREARILAGPGIVAVPGGGDGARLEALLESRAPNAAMIVSAGIAGALDPSLRAGDLVVHQPPFVSSGVGKPRDAFDARSSISPETNGWKERLQAAFPHARHGAIIGQDHIAATVADKAALYAATGALAVDMESHITARIAARHGLPFIAIRAISDTASETLPPAALIGMNPDGSMALGRVLMSLARSPRQLPALLRTGMNSAAALRALKNLGAALEAFPTATL